MCIESVALQRYIYVNKVNNVYGTVLILVVSCSLQCRPTLAFMVQWSEHYPFCWGFF